MAYQRVVLLVDQKGRLMADTMGHWTGRTTVKLMVLQKAGGSAPQMVHLSVDVKARRTAS
jgi:hypothetical protein